MAFRLSIGSSIVGNGKNIELFDMEIQKENQNLIGLVKRSNKWYIHYRYVYYYYFYYRPTMVCKFHFDTPFEFDIPFESNIPFEFNDTPEHNPIAILLEHQGNPRITEEPEELSAADKY